MARAYICDPCLVHMGGHPSVWAAHFASVFREQGIDVTIYSHGHFEPKELGGVPVVRQFTRTAWHDDDTTDILKNWDNYFVNNRRMTEDMTRLSQGIHLTDDGNFAAPAAPMTSDDVVVFTTIIEQQLAGVISWFYKLDPRQRPTVLCYLMGPSGCVLDPASGEASIYSLDTARFYKLAFREVDSKPDRFHFFALGQSHAAQYSYLRGKPVPTYPALNTAIQPDRSLRPAPVKNLLLYAGASTPRKGAPLLPEIVDALAPRYPDWQMLAQLGDDVMTRQGLELHERLAERHKAFENFSYVPRVLNAENYCRLFNAAEIVLIPYDPAGYFNFSSGIVWEAVATANILVVPANCWLEHEARRLGAAFVTFGTHDASSIAEAVSKAIARAPKDRQQRIEAALAFKNENRPEGLIEQISAHWQPA
jgi:glycosyltransferase involved in cell wall biosynthesis